MKPSLNLTDLLDDEPVAVPTPTTEGLYNHQAMPGNGGQPDPDGAASWCLAQHIARQGPAPQPGDNHNSWLTALTKFCNEKGAPLDDVLSLALDTAPHGHNARKIEDTVRGIYVRDVADFGRKPYTTPRGRTEAAPVSPMPADLYDDLPDYLRRCCAPFEGHERAVMLLMTLTVLSGCFPGVGGTYAQRDFGLNLFLFIMAQAASGKGSATWAQALARPWHKRLTAESAAALAEYETEVATRKATEKGKGAAPSIPPAPPRRRMLYIPGNTSAAAILAQLSENGSGGGILFETEADTLSTAMGGEHGKFGDSLRKIAQHETVSVLRKADRQHLDIERPALSIALTGTPGQLPRLMPTAEDGLVSRFLFYSFSQPPVWRDVSPKAGKPLTSYFAPLADELTRMIEATPMPDEDSCYPIQFVLSTADWERINAAGAAGLAEAVDEAGAAGGSTAFRLGLIAWRIAGILTVLRCFENGEAPGAELEADPRDITTAVRIMDTARAHALHVLATLPTTPGARATQSFRFEDKAEKAAAIRALRAQTPPVSWRDIETQTGVPQATARRWAGE